MKLYDNNQFPKLSGIYKITNQINNKCYIGSAVNLKLRLQRHYYELCKQLHNNKYLLQSFNKYGEEQFDIEILEIFETINYNELLNIEKSYILYYDSINESKGYNLMLDNSTHFKNLNKSESHILLNKKRDSKPVCAMNIRTGIKEYEFDSVTDCANFLNTSSSNISRVCKNKLNFIKGYTFCYKNEYDENQDYRKALTQKGKKLSEKQRLLLKQHVQKHKGIKVFKYDLNQNFIEEYGSKNEAEILNNLKKESLRRRLDLETPFEGFYWKSTKI